MKEIISFEDYSKIDIRVGKILTAETPEESEKLLKLKVSFGPEGERTIFAGIKKFYQPESLKGIKTIFVANLASKGTPFGESQGMLFACDGPTGEPQVIVLPEETPEGSRFH